MTRVVEPSSVRVSKDDGTGFGKVWYLVNIRHPQLSPPPIPQVLVSALHVIPLPAVLSTGRGHAGRSTD